jgi:hypothetical protein
MSLKIGYLSWMIRNRRSETKEPTPQLSAHKSFLHFWSGVSDFELERLSPNRETELRSAFEEVLPALTAKMLEATRHDKVSQLTGLALLMAAINEVVGKPLRQTPLRAVLSDPHLFPPEQATARLQRIRALIDFKNSYVEPPARNLTYTDVEQIQEVLLAGAVANDTVEIFGDYAHLVWRVKCDSCNLVFYPAEMFCYANEALTEQAIEFLYAPTSDFTDMSLVFGDGWRIHVWRGFACHHIMNTGAFPWEAAEQVREATGGHIMGVSRKYEAVAEIFADLERKGVGLGKAPKVDPKFSKFFGLGEPIFGSKKISFSDTRPGALGFGVRLEAYITPEAQPWDALVGWSSRHDVDYYEFADLAPASGGHNLPLYSSMKKWEALGFTYASEDMDTSDDYANQMSSSYTITDSDLDNVIFALAGAGWLLVGVADDSLEPDFGTLVRTRHVGRYFAELLGGTVLVDIAPDELEIKRIPQSPALGILTELIEQYAFKTNPPLEDSQAPYPSVISEEGYFSICCLLGEHNNGDDPYLLRIRDTKKSERDHNQRASPLFDNCVNCVVGDKWQIEIYCPGFPRYHERNSWEFAQFLAMTFRGEIVDGYGGDKSNEPDAWLRLYDNRNS